MKIKFLLLVLIYIISLESYCQEKSLILRVNRIVFYDNGVKTEYNDVRNLKYYVTIKGHELKFFYGSHTDAFSINKLLSEKTDENGRMQRFQATNSGGHECIIILHEKPGEYIYLDIFWPEFKKHTVLGLETF